MRKMDVLSVDGTDDQRSDPVMPSACQANGCGGGNGGLHEPVEVGGPVSIGGSVVPPDVIEGEMQHHPAASLEEAWLAAARAIAVRELLILEADDGGADGEAAIQSLLESRVEAERPGEAECRRVYDADPARFRAPELYEAAHILIEPEEDTRGGWHRARLATEKLALEIGGDERAFAVAARKYSGCPSAQQDGSLGQVRRGELTPDIEQALLALDAGEISGEPVRSRHGWHLLRMHRKIAGKTLPFEAVSERIAEMLEARSWTVEAARFIGGLADKHGVEGVDLSPSAS